MIFFSIISFIMFACCICTAILLSSGNKFFRTVFYVFGSFISTLVLLGLFTHVFLNKKELEKEDIYGTYVIDRTKFPGPQADWQYNHFRFEIKEDNTILFYETSHEKIETTHQGSIQFLEYYHTPRLMISIDGEGHHILEEKPTLYRTPWSFYYVFKSPKFGNVFFTKEEWEVIED